MPWHLPADLAWFKRHTWGKPVLMGRKTWQSIGRSLPGRRNIVISRDSALHLPGAEILPSPQAALASVADVPEVMVIGGAEIYRLFLPQADRLYLTLIDAPLDGDAWFPDYTPLNWRQLECVQQPADERNPYGCSFTILEKL